MRATPRWYVIFGIVPAVILVLLLFAVCAFNDVTAPELTRDLAQTAGAHPLTGVLSSLGAMMWCASAAVCAFTAFLLRQAGSKEAFWFFGLCGVLSLYLLLDDFFLIHEYLAPRYLALDEHVIILSLGVSLAGILIGFGRLILATPYTPLCAALVFLAASVSIDAVQAQLAWLGQWRILLEDGMKWLGIVSWCYYFVGAADAVLAERRPLERRERLGNRSMASVPEPEPSTMGGAMTGCATPASLASGQSVAARFRAERQPSFETEA